MLNVAELKFNFKFAVLKFYVFSEFEHEITAVAKLAHGWRGLCFTVRLAFFNRQDARSANVILGFGFHDVGVFAEIRGENWRFSGEAALRNGSYGRYGRHVLGFLRNWRTGVAALPLSQPR